MISLESWKQLYNTYRMNKKVYEAKTAVFLRDGAIVISVDTPNPIVKQQMGSLMERLITPVLELIENISLCEIQPKDQEDFILRWIEMAKGHENFYFSVLLEHGPEACYAVISQDKQNIKTAYLLEHVTPKLNKGNIVYCDPEGFTLNPESGSWEKSEDGKTIYHSEVGVSWEKVLMQHIA